MRCEAFPTKTSPSPATSVTEQTKGGPSSTLPQAVEEKLHDAVLYYDILGMEQKDICALERQSAGATGSRKMGNFG